MTVEAAAELDTSFGSGSAPSKPVQWTDKAYVQLTHYSVAINNLKTLKLSTCEFKTTIYRVPLSQSE